MDKYEYKVRADEIKELIAQGEYAQAAEIADTIDWRRVKSVMMLCTISDLYKINRRYEDARDLLLLAYERRPGGRNICYALCELSIKMQEYVQAVEYFKEYAQVAPKDPGRYILQYKLYEAQEVSLEERIQVLEDLKKLDYREKWAYELAYLYHRMGLETRCVEECDEMILWFGEGPYVIKAMELKMLHHPLSAEQQEKYDHRFDEKPEEEPEEEEAMLVSDQIRDTEEFEQLPEEDAGQTLQDEQPKVNGDTLFDFVGSAVAGKQKQEAAEEPVIPDEAPAEEKQGELDIQVKMMDVGEYNTINLQAELAQKLREVLEPEKAESLKEEELIEDPIMRTIVAPMIHGDTQEFSWAAMDDGEVLEEAAEEEASGETIGEAAEEAAVKDITVFDMMKDVVLAEMAKTSAASDTTAETVMEQMRQEGEASLREQPHAADSSLHVEPPKAIANVLSQESDGQISLVLPENKNNIEKQITGQMSIGDILAEWERLKKENEEKRREDVRQHVLEQTGNMFSEFDAAVRDGLLEQLEKKADAEEVGTTEYESIEGAGEDVEIGEAEATTKTEAPEAEAAEEIVEKTTEETVESAESETATEAAEETAEEQTEEPAESESETATETAEETEEISAEIVEETTEETAEPMTESVTEITEATEATEEIAEKAAAPVKKTEEPENAQDKAAQDKAAQDETVQDREKLRQMTEEEEELYASFIESESTKDQIIRAVDSISLAAYTGNVIITGEEGMDTMSLAKNMISEVQSNDSNLTGKVAKISGQALNRKNVGETLDLLQNGALIIQKACDMDEKTVWSLYKELQRENLGVIVLLEDRKKSMNRFLKENEKLLTLFTARVDVEALSNDVLVAFGKKYAYDNEYSIDDLGILALHTRIEEMQTLDHAVTAPEVKSIVDEAIHHANRKTIAHFFDILLAKRYDEEDMIVLTEKDFA